MKKTSNIHISKYDIILIVVLSLFSIGFPFLYGYFSTPGSEVEIYENNRLIKQLKIDIDSIIELKSTIGKFIVEINKGKVHVAGSQCPAKICMKTGWIHKDGQCIVCAPNKILIKITGGKKQKNQEYNAVSR